MHSPKVPYAPPTPPPNHVAAMFAGETWCVANSKRQRRHYDQDQEQDKSGGDKKVSRREAGKATLEALKPSPTEVLLTINHDNLDGESLGCMRVLEYGTDFKMGNSFQLHFPMMFGRGLENKMTLCSLARLCAGGTATPCYAA